MKDFDLFKLIYILYKILTLFNLKKKIKPKKQFTF